MIIERSDEPEPSFRFEEYTDQSPASANVQIEAEDFALGSLLGAAIEYHFMSNIALSFQPEYFISRGHTFQLNEGPVLSGNLNSVLFSFSLRVFLFQL